MSKTRKLFSNTISNLYAFKFPNEKMLSTKLVCFVCSFRMAEVQSVQVTVETLAREDAQNTIMVMLKPREAMTTVAMAMMTKMTTNDELLHE